MAEAATKKRKPIWQPIVLGTLAIAYPIAVYFGLTHFEPRHMAWLLLIPTLVHNKNNVYLSIYKPLALAAGALAILTVIFNHSLPLKLYPIVITLLSFSMFAATLIYPPSMIERIARMREPNLPSGAIAYTRKVTVVWCGFFLLNASISAATALWASNKTWALYNGFISYILTGLLFVGEWLVRRRVRAKHDI